MPVEEQRILIVDDAPENIQILNEALRSDYEICFALNGEDAIQNALAVKPDLILLDIMMPEMDGYEVCIAMKENPALKDIPVIFITALEQADHETRGLELGAVDYVTKPFNPAIVRLRVHNHLELKRQRDALAARNEDLREALSKIKTLSGLLPICSSCKKIRDDKGYWSQIEGYISDHSAAEFSHSICPDCAKKLYPGLCDEIYPENKPSHGLQADRDECLAAGMNDHLSKPMTEADLKKALERSAGGKNTDYQIPIDTSPPTEKEDAMEDDSASLQDNWVENKA